MSSGEKSIIATWGVRRRVLLGVTAVVVLVVAVYLLIPSDSTFIKLNEAKKVRATTAVVKAKEIIKFDEKNHSYIGNLGDSIEGRPGTEQWRVYYQIENFDQVPEPKRSQLWQSEEARIKRFGYRFTWFEASEKEFYDRTQIGDRLEVQYRYIVDEKEIIGVRNLTHPDG